MSWQVGARLAGVLGGVCWLARAVLDAAGGPDSLVNGLHWGGVALMVLALLAIGAGLVSTDLVPLRLVVAACLVVLAVAVVSWLDGEFSDRWVDGAIGVLFGLFCSAGLVRPRLGNARGPSRVAQGDEEARGGRHR